MEKKDDFFKYYVIDYKSLAVIGLTSYGEKEQKLLIPQKIDNALVTNIGSEFRNYNNIQEIVIPPSVETIESNAFSFCWKLKNVIIERKMPPTLNQGAFSWCKKDLTIYIPNGSEWWYQKEWGNNPFIIKEIKYKKDYDNNIIICLANSKKDGGRCIIGKTLDGKWIRPIDNKLGTLDEKQVRHINTLNLISIPELQYYPQKHQTENYTFGHYYQWKCHELEYDKKDDYIELLFDNTNSISLDNYCDHPDSLWNNHYKNNKNDRIIASYVIENISNSAYLIKVNKSKLSLNYYRGKTTIKRIKFDYNNKTYDLSVTDNHSFDNLPWDDKFTIEQNNPDNYDLYKWQYICIVLGQPFNDGYCYLLATSLIVCD